MSTDERFWIVLDEDGEPCHCASWPEACHEHINEAIAEEIEDAEKWVVREVQVVSPPVIEPMKPEHAAIYHGDCDGDEGD